MSAFEELGVAPELIRAVERMGWTLPTPIQAEAIPLVLGGGDIMAAAETGSGKTGAFALPVLQLVHETLVHKNRQGISTDATLPTLITPPCQLNADDRDDTVALGPDGLTCQSRAETAWGGCRATRGVFSGAFYFETIIQDDGLCRVGWATAAASRDVGTDKVSFGYGGTGKKSHGKQFSNYGEPFGVGDVVGSWLDCGAGTISFSKNGRQLGVAFYLPDALRGQPLFPAVTLKNAEVSINFGATPFKGPLPDGASAMAMATTENSITAGQVVPSDVRGEGVSFAPQKPVAIILEPARDLAEQTFTNVVAFAQHLATPRVGTSLLVGGVSASQQIKELKNGGVSIVVGTPGRVVDLFERGELSLDSVKFFVLDEADRLLDTGNREGILKLYKRLPKGGSGDTRLQVLMFSATLHSDEVKALAGQICDNPVLVDLKGRDAVPETVDHVVVRIDPTEDRTWLQSEPTVWTDGMHAVDPQLGPTSNSKEAFSEAIKRLKPRLLQRLIDSLNMEQALIFCRTNYDCDNLEKFLNSLGASASGAAPKRLRLSASGAATGPQSAYSCLVLAGARSMEERRAALRAFKDSDVRFLIATDVAARGIDVQGLPFVVNITLPDRSEDYVHRIGRVGRADAVGLAISLVATVPEKVWFCTQKGLKPWLTPDAKNTRLTDEGGHAIWYDEPGLLQAVEKRLGHAVAILPPDLTLPPEIAKRVTGSGGDVKYGQSRGADNAFMEEMASRTAAMGPAVGELSALEHAVQASYFALKSKWNACAMNIG